VRLDGDVLQGRVRPEPYIRLREGQHVQSLQAADACVGVVGDFEDEHLSLYLTCRCSQRCIAAARKEHSVGMELTSELQHMRQPS
jgi:hypothetical protein